MMWKAGLLASMVVFDTLKWYLAWRQLKLLSKGNSPEVEELIKGKDEEYAKAKSYTRDKSRFGLVESIFLSTASFIAISFNVLAKLYTCLLTWPYLADCPYPAVKSAVFVLTIFFISDAISIPFGIYETFVLEEKHGFNRTTWKTFVIDQLKGWFLLLVFSPIIALLLQIVEWAGPRAYIYVWVAVAILTLAMSFIVPTVIMPMFNKFENLKDETLRGSINALAKRVDFPLTKIYEMDGSKRSAHSNAALYGFWKNKRILLFDTILKMDHQQILSILAHELGHWKMGHSLKGLALALAILFIQLYLFSVLAFTPSIYKDFGFDPAVGPKDDALLRMRCFQLNKITGWMSNCITRRHEYEADAFAADLGYSDDLQKALIAVCKDNKVVYEFDKWYSIWNHDHPTLLERLNALKRKRS